jgi:hypothetical protein
VRIRRGVGGHVDEQRGAALLTRERPAPRIEVDPVPVVRDAVDGDRLDLGFFAGVFDRDQEDRLLAGLDAVHLRRHGETKCGRLREVLLGHD